MITLKNYEIVIECKLPSDRISLFGEIYKWTNKSNGKVYIGQAAKSINDNSDTKLHTYRRAIGHISDVRCGRNSCRRFYNALRRHGDPEQDFLDAFDLSVIDWATNQYGLDLLEKMYIEKYRATESAFGYNIQPGGHNGPMNKETCKKISESKRLRREALAKDVEFPILAMPKDNPKLERMYTLYHNYRYRKQFCSEWMEKKTGWSRFYHDVGQYITAEYFTWVTSDGSKTFTKENMIVMQSDSEDDRNWFVWNVVAPIAHCKISDTSEYTRRKQKERYAKRKEAAKTALEETLGFPLLLSYHMLTDPLIRSIGRWYDDAKRANLLCSEWTEKQGKKCIGWSRFYHEIGSKIKSKHFMLEPIDSTQVLSKDNCKLSEFDSFGDRVSAGLRRGKTSQ